MSKAEYFRARAAECDELAEKATDPKAKRMLREAAEHWRFLAAQAEQLRP